MKRFLLGLLFSFASTLLLVPARADHIIGSDITYTCLDSGKYKIVMKFYRDCNGCYVLSQPQPFCGTGENCNASSTAPTSLTVSPIGACGVAFPGNVSMTRTSIIDITPTCKSVNSRCTPPCGGAYPYGIEEHTFEGIVDLSNYKNNGCCKVKISVQLSARSIIITTGQAGGSFWTSCEIDVCQTPCNSSPALSNKPIAIVCCNQPYGFNNGAVDTLDRDSLSFAKAIPYNGDGVPAPFAIGLSKSTPVPVYLPGGKCQQIFPTFTPPIGYYLDSITGDLIFTPASNNCTNVGCPWIGVVAIDIIEWRRVSGVMQEIGRTRRDMQFIAQNCPANNPPTLSDSGSKTVCEGEQICIVITSNDKPFIPPPPTPAPPPDSVTLTWNAGIPGATFSIIDPNARLQSGRFCWTPPEGKASTIPYQFTVTARDNACPVNGTFTKSYNIRVNPKPHATRTFTLLPCGKLKVEVNSTSILKAIAVEIRDSLNPIPVGPEYVDRSVLTRAIDTAQFRKGGRYIFSTRITNTFNCTSLYLDTLNIPPLLEVDLALADTFVCAGKDITLTAQVKNGLAPFRYQWATGNPNDTLASMEFDNIPHDSTTVILVTDKNGCTAFDTAIIKYVPLPVTNLGNDQRICDYDSVTLDAQNPGKVISWSTGDTSQTIVVKAAGQYVLKVTDASCFKLDTFQLLVNKHVEANAGGDQPICFGESYLLRATGADTSQLIQSSYTWYNADNGLVIGNLDTVRISPATPTNYTVVLSSIENGVTCTDPDTINILVNPLPTLTKGSLEDLCYTYGTINFAVDQAFLPAGGKYYYMKDTSLMPDRRSIKTWELSDTPGVTVDVMITYIYQDPSTGCVNKDSIRQRILRVPEVRVKDTTYCYNVPPVNLRNHVLAPLFINGAEEWKCLNFPDAVTKDASNTYMFDPKATPAPYQYTLVYHYTDGSGCYKEDTALINVIDIPTITSMDNGPYCFKSMPYPNLNDQSGVQPAGGRWKCNSNPNLVLGGNTLKTDETPGVFWLVYEHDLTGCLVVDSTQVTINDLPYVETSIPAGKEQVCKTTPAFNMNSIPATGGTWSSAYPGLISTAGRIDPSAKPDDGQITGAYRVIFTYTDPGTGCTSIDSETVEIQEPPGIELEIASESLCEGETFSLKATPTNAVNGFTWTSNGTGTFSPDDISAEVTYQPSDADNFPGNIILTVTTNTFGVCPQASKQQAISINPIPRGRIVNSYQGCAPLEVNFAIQVDTPSTGVLYNWDFGDATSPDNSSNIQNPSHTYLKEGNYQVRIILTTDKGCADTIIKPDYVKVYPVPVADFDVNPADHYTTIALPKFEFINKSYVSTGSLGYEWDFGQVDNNKDTSTLKDPVWYYSNQADDTGAYVVTLVVTTDQGCKAIDTVTVVIGPELTIFIPNAFSPGRNGEAKNDKFYVTGQGFASFDMQIYNRWGEKLYETKKADADHGWTGSYKGTLCQQDVYVYQITITNYAGKQFKYSGTVTLLR